MFSACETITDNLRAIPYIAPMSAVAFLRTDVHRAGPTVTLRIVSGPHKAEEVTLDSHQTLVVGRAAEVQWRMTKDAFFSRYHFRIVANPPHCRVEDLESTNGTQVNGRRVASSDLNDGDQIECGETTFKVLISPGALQCEDSTTEVPPADRSKQELTQTIDVALPGNRLGSFAIGRELGRGTMGIVYHAIHDSTGREAAVKLIQPTAAARPDSFQLFLREVVLLGQLRHQRIVEYLSHGLHEGRMFLAMEYLPVLDVRDVLASQSPPKRVRLACSIICRVLEALQFAHERNVVHRDVKPSNIFAYKEKGRLQIKLGDFGLAKNYLYAGLSSISCENPVRGTLNYMSPEQLINCRYAKPAADIYAAGVCLYLFLSGRLPFELDESSNPIAQILNSPPKPLTPRAADVASELVTIVERAMNRDPSGRFTSAAEMRSALMGFTDKA
jgi:hypothetical protein